MPSERLDFRSGVVGSEGQVQSNKEVSLIPHLGRAQGIGQTSGCFSHVAKRSRRSARLALCWLWCFALLSLSSSGVSGAAPAVSLTKSVSPTSVVTGGRVTYTITLSNSGSEAAEGFSVRDTLPAGFAYRSGTARVAVNGVNVPGVTFTAAGNTLTWSGLKLPAGRSASFYGIHTFVQRRTNLDYINYQLNRSQELAGSGSYVTQLLDWISKDWPGPPSWAVDFVNRAYDRSLTPVIRLAGTRGQTWIKPQPDPDGSYASTAQAFKRVVQGLPRRDGFQLYVQVWNEPNLNEEWEGQSNPEEYGHFLVDVAAAIRSIGDARIVILNGPLSPGGEYYYLDYLDDMLGSVPSALWAFDVWASHPYPNNHPPEYNIHNGTATYQDASIDLYQRELAVLAQHGRSGLKVLLTETGYALGQADFVFEGYPAIDEARRADYVQRAFRDYWRAWPEVLGVCPYELVDPDGQWWVWDWLYPNGTTHQQYDTVKNMDKSYAPVNSVLKITFEATASSSPGAYSNQVLVSGGNLSAPISGSFASVTVLAPTPTRTPTFTATPSATATDTQTPTPSATLPTQEPATLTPSPTITLTLTETPTASAIPSATLTPTGTVTTLPSETPSATWTASSTPPPSQTPTWTATATWTPSPTATPTLTHTPTATASPSPAPSCLDLITNGDFEGAGGWNAPAYACPAYYSTSQRRSGQRSMVAGVEPGGVVTTCYSTFWQAINVPSGAGLVRLACWYYLSSIDAQGDFGYVSIHDDATMDQLVRIATPRGDSQAWTPVDYVFDASLKGRRVRVLFGAYNNGNNDLTALYVDDVAVVACGVGCNAYFTATSTATLTRTPSATAQSPTPSATATFTHTPTATATRTTPPTPSATPSPSATATATHTPSVTPTGSPLPSVTPTLATPTPTCAELVANGGFETDEAWLIPQTAYPAAYTTQVAHGGQRAMRLGMEAADNVSSYSTVWQPIRVPTDAGNPVLTFWYYPVSDDAARDLEYALILDASGNILDWVLSTRSNAQEWKRVEYSLSDYRGVDIRINFGVYNDGGETGATTMYIDDVSISSCGQPVLLQRLLLPLVLRSFNPESTPAAAFQSTPAGARFPSRVQALWQPVESADAPSFEQGIALDPARSVLYMASGKELRALDVESGSELARTPLPSAARGLAVDVDLNRIYAALWQADALAIVDGASHKLLQLVRGIPGASGVAISRSVVFATATRSDELIVIDRQTGSIIQRVSVGDAPYAVACDEGSRQWAFVANAGEDTLSIVGGGTVLRTVKLGGLGHPQGLALDGVRDRLYVTYSLSPKYGAIAAIDATSGQVLTRLTGNFLRPLFGAYGVAVDPLRGWVYVTTANETLVLAGETLTILHALKGVGPASGFGVQVDAVARRLYVAERRQGSLLVCDW